MISPKVFLQTIMQTQQRTNLQDQNIDMEQDENERGPGFLSPPNLCRNPTDPTGINFTPHMQQRPPTGGLSALLQQFLRGAANQQIPEQQDVDPPEQNPPGTPPPPPPGGVPPVPAQQQPQQTVADLLAQLFQQYQPQPVPPPPPPTMAPAIDPNMAAILAMMQAQQAQTTAVLCARQGGNKPALSFPTWDGQSSTKGLFIERLKTFQKDDFFTGMNWTKKDPAFQKQSTWLRDAILKSLPEDYLSTFKDRREFEDDGFAMFNHLLTELTPTSLDTLILDVIELGTLEMRPQETPKAFLARARRLMNSLESVKIPQIIPLFVLLGGCTPEMSIFI
jgi:hypothetical protein